jgi:hypothetical protein
VFNFFGSIFLKGTKVCHAAIAQAFESPSPTKDKIRCAATRPALDAGSQRTSALRRDASSIDGRARGLLLIKQIDHLATGTAPIARQITNGADVLDSACSGAPRSVDR